VVRRGIHTSDLARIRTGVEKAAISEFKTRKSRKPKIDSAQYEELKTEKERLDGAGGRACVAEKNDHLG